LYFYSTLYRLRSKKPETRISQKKKTQRVVSFCVCALFFTLLSPGYAQAGYLFFLSSMVKKNVENVMFHAVLPKSPPKNILPISVVHIYAEGLEATFFDQNIFPDLMPKISNLSQKGLVVQGITQVALTGWTAAGQIASQCGYPGVEGKQEFVQSKDRWPCVGDILSKENYHMVYLNGSSLDFAGKGDFWKSHGYNQAFGDQFINDLAKTPHAPMSSWGAYDDTLMSASFNVYNDLQNKKPFVLTMLTVDTHAPTGLKTPSCKNIPKYQMKDSSKTPQTVQAAHCADFVIGGFLEKILKNLPEDTIVILQSDHLQTPRADSFLKLETSPKRANLFMAWGKNIAPQILIREATMFDVGPTILGLMGRSPGGLNLGRDLMAKEKTLVELHGYPWMEERMILALSDERMASAADVEKRRNEWATAQKEKRKIWMPSGTRDPFLEERLKKRQK